MRTEIYYYNLYFWAQQRYLWTREPQKWFLNIINKVDRRINILAVTHVPLIKTTGNNNW